MCPEKSTKIVQQIMKHPPSSSFWLMSQPGSTSFKAAFRDAWKMFLKDHQKQATLRSALGRLSNDDEQELVKIILANRLPHAHRQ
ncbi:hypothetical protein D9758_008308 [Tetrapyrgos nigripes]|uniref:Uncharacterized protein n=1 Tax=Tetrapyrgos nigripes TaxID=182062 RepID=A0A8H5LN10_9AGAR|nr:hypothetical protein D9758_008308 [Tetrapyrgos nigripes]